MTKKQKQISLGALIAVTAVAVPVATVVSCGNAKNAQTLESKKSMAAPTAAKLKKDAYLKLAKELGILRGINPDGIEPANHKEEHILGFLRPGQSLVIGEYIEELNKWESKRKVVDINMPLEKQENSFGFLRPGNSLVIGEYIEELNKWKALSKTNITEVKAQKGKLDVAALKAAQVKAAKKNLKLTKELGILRGINPDGIEPANHKEIHSLGFLRPGNSLVIGEYIEELNKWESKRKVVDINMPLEKQENSFGFLRPGNSLVIGEYIEELNKWKALSKGNITEINGKVDTLALAQQLGLLKGINPDGIDSAKNIYATKSAKLDKEIISLTKQVKDLEEKIDAQKRSQKGLVRANVTAYGIIDKMQKNAIVKAAILKNFKLLDIKNAIKKSSHLAAPTLASISSKEAKVKVLSQKVSFLKSKYNSEVNNTRSIAKMQIQIIKYIDKLQSDKDVVAAMKKAHLKLFPTAGYGFKATGVQPKSLI